MSVDVRRADFDHDREAIRRIRFTVFVEEQRVPEELEIDDRDPHCIHLLAYVGQEPVGTARIDLAHAGKIGRVAVLAAHRRSGVGAALMAALHHIAREHGLTGVWCYAQVGAVPFYRRLGYRITSDPFDDAGIEHVRMDR